MYNRLKEIRKTLKLNQEKFAKEIGLAQNSYSAIEIGKTTLTEQNIKLICFAFGINEHWLRTGQGERFIRTTPSDEMEILAIFRQLSPEVQKLFLDYGHVLLDNEQKLRKQAAQYADTEKMTHPIHDQDRA